MAKSAKPKCCPPRPFIFIEILLGDGGSSEDSFLLQEDDFYILQETDDKIIL